MAKQTDADPLGYTIKRAANKISLSETMTRKLVVEGSIPSIRVGRRWIIPAKALEAWVDNQSNAIGQ